MVESPHVDDRSPLELEVDHGVMSRITERLLNKIPDSYHNSNESRLQDYSAMQTSATMKFLNHCMQDCKMQSYNLLTYNTILISIN